MKVQGLKEDPKSPFGVSKQQYLEGRVHLFFTSSTIQILGALIFIYHNAHSKANEAVSRPPLGWLCP